MLRLETPLVDVLYRRLGPDKARRALEEAGRDLGLSEDDCMANFCAACALLKIDFQVEEVSRFLSWQDFELLSGALLRASGFEVKNNVVLKKPKAQIDIVAKGPSLVLSIDCKHYRRSLGIGALRRQAIAQLRRSGLLRAGIGDSRPVVSVILGMSEPEGGFVEGVAVVPIRTLRSFLTTIDSYKELLALR